MRKIMWSIGIMILLVSCAPKVTVDVKVEQPTLDFKQEVKLLNIVAEVPPEAQFIGTVKVGDTGFTIDCGYEVVVEKIKMEARKAGGNLVKIIDHKKPDIKSSCHRISAKIFFLKDIDKISLEYSTKPVYFDSTANYALLHVYRPGGMGVLVNYKIHLGDMELCRVKNNFHETIIITKEGPNEIWAKTESKTVIPINIEYGREYYLRCGVSMGFFLGRPTLTIVDSSTGKTEFESLRKKSNE